MIKDCEKRALAAESALESERNSRQKTESRTLAQLRDAEEAKSDLFAALEQVKELSRTNENLEITVEHEKQMRRAADDKLSQNLQSMQCFLPRCLVGYRGTVLERVVCACGCQPCRA